MFAFIIRKQPQARLASYFAVELTGLRVIPVEERGNGARSLLSKLIYRQMDFVRGLGALPGDAAVDLRYLADPARPGNIRIYFLIRMLADTPGAAREQAARACRYVLHMLMVNNYMHEFRAVEDEKELRYLMKPFHASNIVDIVRREAILQLDALRQLPRREVGFGAPAGVDCTQLSQNSIYYVFPFAPGLCAMERLCHVLLLQKQPCMLSVCVKPYQLTDTDETALHERIKRCEKYSQLGFGGGVENADGLEPFLQKQAASLYETCATEFYQLQDAAFMVKIQVASSGPIADELTTVAGCSITEHAGHPDFVFVQQSEKAFAGGYECVRPQDDVEYRAAVANLEHMEFGVWEPTLAPPEIEHLRYVFDVSESIAPFRLPLPLNAEFPGVDTIMFSSKTAPSDLPPDGLFLGMHSHMSQVCPVYLPIDDRRRHMYTVGQTGTGKSKFFLQMIVQDMKAGRGLGVFDPHGELIEDVLRHVPADREKDIVYLDPGVKDSAFGISMLEAKSPVEKDYCVNYLLEIFGRLYDLKMVGGPIFEQYMRNAIQTLFEQPPDYQPGLMDVVRIFEDTEFRRRMLSTCTSPTNVRFWKLQAEKVGGEGSLTNMGPYITAKLTQFTYNLTARDILCQRRSTIDMRKIMDEGRILLVDLRKGMLGDTNVKFLGMLMIGKILFAALSRTNVRDKDSMRDFYLYVDEFQNFITDSFVSALSEARKYRLCLTLTNQYINQLHNRDLGDQVAASIFGNIGTLVGFRVGAKDSEYLYDEFGGTVSRSDIQGLSNYNAYIRMLVDGNVSSPFNIRTLLPPPPEHKVDVDGIIARSVASYYRSRADIADEIRKEMEAAD